MRAYELIDKETNTLTMRHLHKLKKLRQIKKIEKEKKLKLIATMYGDTVARAEKEQRELESQHEKLDLEIQKIQNEIELAEIDNERREKIKKMAMRSVMASMKGG